MSVDKSTTQLTIGMAVYEDFDGVYFTTQAARYYHQEVGRRVKYIVIDNCPNGKHSKTIKEFVETHVRGKYIGTEAIKGTAVRDLLFENAETEYVMCIDSHVLIEPGGIKALLDYYDKNPKTNDLIQGPLVSDDIYSMFSHFDTTWRSGMFGTWAIDARANNKYGEPFDIPSQGLGLFSCRKEAWPGFNRNFRGFGGEEFYIHEKFRRLGRRTLCLPALRWIHRFQRPNGTIYKVSWEDRIRNYMLGWAEIGRSDDDIVEHFTQLLGAEAANKIIADVRKELSATNKEDSNGQPAQSNPERTGDAQGCAVAGSD